MSNLQTAHKHCYKHKPEIEQSTVCGCFYCMTIFDSFEINEWIDRGRTALCPKCGIDSVIGDASGIDLAKNFLEQMHDAYFGMRRK